MTTWMRLVRTQGLTSGKIRHAVDDYEREDLPRIEQAPGFLGIALGENHVGGSIGSVTFWDSEQTMRDTERLSAAARERAMVTFRAPEPMLVDHFAMIYASSLTPLVGQTARPYLRLVRYTALTSEAIERASDSYRRDVEREAGELPGLEGVALGANPRAGSLVVLSFWKSERVMRDSEWLSLKAIENASEAASRQDNPLFDYCPLVDRLEVTLASHLDRLADVAVAA